MTGLPAPGMQMALDLNAETRRRRLAEWVRNNSSALVEKEKGVLGLDIEDPASEQAKLVFSLLQALGFSSRTHWSLLKNPRAANYFFERAANTYKISLDLTKDGEIVCLTGVIVIPPGESFLIYL